MDPKFPVFLKDRDGWMYLLQYEKDIGRIEKIDIEGNEYIGWDVEGRRIQLKSQDENISIFLSGEGLFPHELRKSIIAYGNIACSKGISLQGNENIGVLELFFLVEQNIHRSRLIVRIASYIRRIYSIVKGKL